MNSKAQVQQPDRARVAHVRWDDIATEPLQGGMTRRTVEACELILIPCNLLHRAVAFEDTLDVDVFDPPGQDWLQGTDAYLKR